MTSGIGETLCTRSGPAHRAFAGLLVALAALAMVAPGGCASGDAATRSPREGRQPPMAPQGDNEALETTRPVIDTDFPDPDVLRVGGVYYAYATNTGGLNVPYATAASVRGPWRRQPTDALPALGAWAERGRTWAPDVSRRPDGTFVLYYTAHHRKSGRQCIGAATAASPEGPFQPVGRQPLICPERGGAIDAASFTDTDGTPYLLYRSDGGPRRPTAIYLQRLGPFRVGTTAPPVKILTKDDSDPRLVEAPALIRHGSKYVLFYSSGVFYDEGYRTSYAVSAALKGPYRKGRQPLMSTDSFDRKIIGPGGADVVQDPSGDHVVFHGITRFKSGQSVTRAMYVARLGWAHDRPLVRGSRSRYEAENGWLSQSRVIDADDASEGKAVTFGDRQESWTEFDVFAPQRGPYSLKLRYRTRSAGAARQELSVNGLAYPLLSFPGGTVTGWQDATTEVNLRAGWNAVRLRRTTGEIDLDHAEVR